MAELVSFTDGEQALEGWLLRPKGKARASVLIYPTIANRNPAMEARAAMFAEEGCLVMIADFYGEAVTSFDAAKQMGATLRKDWRHYRRRITASLEAFHALAGPQPIIAAGYCMGGQAALELARANAPVAAVASFHGLLDTQSPALCAIQPRVLVCHGHADPMVPPDQVAAFQAEMEAAQADWQRHIYARAVHGFTDPASDGRGVAGVGFNASADRQSWAAMMTLLDEVAPN